MIGCRTVRNRSLVIMTLAGLMFCLGWGFLFSARGQGSEADSSPPVILLTGFEPFGPARTPNPSWEAIKALDGTIWHGYRLVCRQLPVVWGMPLPTLRKAIAEVHPVAVFAFGQGADFTIETMAENRRENLRDNLGVQPSQRDIIPGGPVRLSSSRDASALADVLASQGYRVRVSSDAGGYLCEETLYCLEYLRQSQFPEMSVLFCHVPGPESDPESLTSVQNFVRGVLVAWNDGQGQRAAETGQGSEADPRDKEVRRFIETYFRTWSAGEMDQYAACFHAGAVIQFVDKERIRTQLAPQFLAEQRQYQSGTSRSMEVPLSAEVRFEGAIARAIVRWKLLGSNGRTKYGYDHFTLIRQENGWKIANLLFYETPAP
jgi:pyroglutamyl-peptidase